MSEEEKKNIPVEETPIEEAPVGVAPTYTKPAYQLAAEEQNAKDVVNSAENVKKYDADRSSALEIKNKVYTPGSQVSGFAPVGNNWDADQTQVYGKLNEPDPLKAKFTDKLRYLAEVDALNSLKEWEAGDRSDMKARSRIKPDTLGTFRKLLKSNPATEKDPLMLAAKQDFSKGVGNVMQGLGEGFENFAKGYTGRDWTTAQQKREGLAQQEKATAAQTEALKAEQKFQTARDEATQKFQAGESALNRTSQEEQAKIGALLTMRQLGQKLTAAEQATLDKAIADAAAEEKARATKIGSAGVSTPEASALAATTAPKTTLTPADASEVKVGDVTWTYFPSSKQWYVLDKNGKVTGSPANGRQQTQINEAVEALGK
jgi:hypothetical protein